MICPHCKDGNLYLNIDKIRCCVVCGYYDYLPIYVSPEESANLDKPDADLFSHASNITKQKNVKGGLKNGLSNMS